MVAVAARCVHGSPGRSMDPDSLRPDLRGLRCGEELHDLPAPVPEHLVLLDSGYDRDPPLGAERSLREAPRPGGPSVRLFGHARAAVLDGSVCPAGYAAPGGDPAVSGVQRPPVRSPFAAPLVPLAPGRVEARLALSQRLAWDVHAVDLARQRHEVGAPLTRFSGRAGARVRWPRTPAARLRRGRRGPDARSVRVPARSRPPGRLRAAAGQSDVFDSERYAVPVGWRRRRARSTPSRSVSARRCNSTCPAHFRLRHGASCTVSVPVA